MIYKPVREVFHVEKGLSERSFSEVKRARCKIFPAGVAKATLREHGGAIQLHGEWYRGRNVQERNRIIKKSRERSRDQAKAHEYQERHTYTNGRIIKIFDDSFHGRIRFPG